MFFKDGDQFIFLNLSSIMESALDQTQLFSGWMIVDEAVGWSCLIHVFPTSTQVTAYLKNQNVSHINSK